MSLRQAQASKQAPLLAEAYKIMGNLCLNADRHPQALTYYDKSKAIYVRCLQRGKSKEVIKGLVSVENSIATVLYQQNNAYAAISTYINAIRYSTMSADSFHLDEMYNNIGAVFVTIDQPEKALDYMLKSLQIKEVAANKAILILAYTNVASTYLNLHKVATARQYLNKADSILKIDDSMSQVAYYYAALGRYHTSQKHYRQAEQSLLQALHYIRRDGVNVQAHSSYIYQLLTDVYLARQRYGPAQVALDSAWQLNRVVGDAEMQVKLVDRQAQLEEHRGQFAAAAAHYRQYAQLHDSLTKQQARRQVNIVENKYQVAQKEQRITQLQRLRRLQATELHQQKKLSYTYLSLLAAAAGLGALGYVNVRNRQKIARQQQALQAQKILDLEQQRQLSAAEAMLRGQEDERRRVARDLHDGLGGMLSTVKLYLGTVRGNLVLPEESARLFARSLDHLDESISEMRRVARDLMPEALLHFGLVPALQDVCEAVRQTRGLAVQFQALGFETAETQLPQRTEVVVYRLVQELLNNALRHAQARSVIVQLARHGAQVQVVVEDDGSGFDPATQPAGVGLRSVQARVDYLRGTLEVQSAPGQGTSVSIEFQLPAA